MVCKEGRREKTAIVALCAPVDRSTEHHRRGRAIYVLQAS
jgi:hypothetical protein